MWVKEKNILKSAIGLATINAACNQGTDAVKNGNVMEALKIKATEGFGMVGHFSPLLAQAKKMTENIFVFERQVEEGSGLYPESAMPQLTIAAMSSSSPLPVSSIIRLTTSYPIVKMPVRLHRRPVDAPLPQRLPKIRRSPCWQAVSLRILPGSYRSSAKAAAQEMKQCIQHVLLKI